MSKEARNDWSLDEVREVFDMPLLELVVKANAVLRSRHNPQEIQTCTLISIKTGGCSEDCKYCAQSGSYKTSVMPGPLMSFEEVFNRAKKAKEEGATRICLGAGWRSLPNAAIREKIVSMIKEISHLGVEVCCTLGFLSEEDAKVLEIAGLYAYNHNLDTSERFYPEIITTRTFKDRIRTLDLISSTSIKLCTGAILGMGENCEDRIALLHLLATRKRHPESIPINILSPIAGTPLENSPHLPIWDVVRVIATARILMPEAMIRLSAGRLERTDAEQALCFLAGANSIFYGEKLLTVDNPAASKDDAMFQLLGLIKKPSFT